MSKSVFQTEEKDKVLIIKAPASLSNDDIDCINVDIKNWQLKTHKVFLFDMSETRSIEQLVYTCLINFSRALKKVDKFLMTINAPAMIKTEIKEKGLGSSFNLVSSMEECYDKACLRGKKAKVKLDVNFLSPFVEATQNVFEVQMETKLQALKLYMKKEDEVFDVKVAGVINLVCADFTGSISVCFSEKVFLNVYAAMTGEEHSEISSEHKDAAGEILNMIYGHAKTLLNQKGFELEKALPTVIMGEKMELHQGEGKKVLIIPFESELGAFHLEVMLSEY